MNKKMIRYIVGSIIMLEAALLLLPILTAIVYGEWNTLRPSSSFSIFHYPFSIIFHGATVPNE